jgi:hypothetical protein
VSVNQSYGASGDQARAVAAGQPADVVNLSLDPDIDLLVRKNVVPKTWKANAHRGIVSDSVVVLVVRDSNPKHIKGWNDLIKSGAQVITPNPFTSGGARWNVMAAYGALRRQRPPGLRGQGRARPRRRPPPARAARQGRGRAARARAGPDRLRAHKSRDGLHPLSEA